MTTPFVASPLRASTLCLARVPSVDTPATPHAAYDRDIARRERWGDWWRGFGRVASALIVGALAVVLVVLLVISVLDLRQPVIWGTFTQTDCEPRPRGGCRAIGTWVSDDGDLVRHDVYLDGWPEDDGTSRASYQPTAILGGESADIVHSSLLTGVAPWVIGALLLWGLCHVLGVDVRRLLARARRRSRAGSSAPPSLRREYRRSLDTMRPPETGA
ncbi:hypothetical protein FHS07_000844 [Microbacterium proteolyticum]|uniref:Transmembrane protein n=1 Tax=Microbacterium proteolyticum TaxID=1572644 RepID=A0A7W5CGB3_9MICO|nr:hypothetical protein [Microbacterium proteolyticum]MBB3157160.1 hypothetical protein [Microbacterium proteolyticum]